jgi:hypothetical protein
MQSVQTVPAAVYEPRNPPATSLYALVEDYYEEFERAYEDCYQQLSAFAPPAFTEAPFLPPPSKYRLGLQSGIAGKCFGSNVSLAIRSVAALLPQEVCCPPCPCSCSASARIPVSLDHTLVRIRVRTGAGLPNPPPNTVRDIPNGRLSISCLKLTSIPMSEFMKSASSPAGELCAPWS